MEAGTDGEAIGPAAIGEDIVEWVGVDGVELDAHAEVFGDNDIAASAYTVEAGPIELESCGRELVGYDGGEGVARVWDSSLTECAERWPDED